MITIIYNTHICVCDMMIYLLTGENIRDPARIRVNARDMIRRMLISDDVIE